MRINYCKIAIRTVFFLSLLLVVHCAEDGVSTQNEKSPTIDGNYRNGAFYLTIDGELFHNSYTIYDFDGEIAESASSISRIEYINDFLFIGRYQGEEDGSYDSLITPVSQVIYSLTDSSLLLSSTVYEYRKNSSDSIINSSLSSISKNGDQFLHRRLEFHTNYYSLKQTYRDNDSLLSDDYWSSDSSSHYKTITTRSCSFVYDKSELIGYTQMDSNNIKDEIPAFAIIPIKKLDDTWYISDWPYQEFMKVE